MKKIRKLLLSITFAFALLLALPAILPDYSYTTEVQAAQQVKKSLTIFKGNAFRISVNTNAPTKWKWTSSNSSVATVSYTTAASNKPKITAVNYGTATIKGSYGSNVVYYNITVAKLSKYSVGLYKGNTYTLSVTGSPTSITWKSADSTIATVSSKGKITAKKAGTTKVTATVTSYIGTNKIQKNFICTVTVRNIPTSIQTNLTTLKNTISKSSLVTSAGNHYIKLSKTSKTMTYTYTILYDKTNDRLKFTYKATDSSSKKAVSISFYVYNTSKTYKIAPVISATTPKNIQFKTKTSLDRRSLSKTTNLTFSITSSNVTLTSSYKASMQEISNTYLQHALTGWNNLIKTKTGLTLKNIGFTSYS